MLSKLAKTPLQLLVLMHLVLLLAELFSVAKISP